MNFIEIRPGTDAERKLYVFVIYKIAFIFVWAWPPYLRVRSIGKVYQPTARTREFWPSVFRRDEWLRKTKI